MKIIRFTVLLAALLLMSCSKDDDPASRAGAQVTETFRSYFYMDGEVKGYLPEPDRFPTVWMVAMADADAPRLLFKRITGKEVPESEYYDC